MGQVELQPPKRSLEVPHLQVPALNVEDEDEDAHVAEDMFPLVVEVVIYKGILSILWMRECPPGTPDTHAPQSHKLRVRFPRNRS